MTRVLVTGGSGFIGSHVVDKLADAGLEPRIYDLQPSPHHEPGSVDTVIGDLFEPETLLAAMEDCDAVVHLAAYADVGIVADQPADAERCNARGTLAVLEAARATGTRVVYGSTIWVYGASGDGLIDEESPLGLPDHLYTASKLAGEMYCSSYAELYDVPCTILRFGIPYGPRARPAAVIPIFVSKALKGEPLTIAGDGLQTRRFVYVEDLAAGVVAGVRHGGGNRVFNLAGDETVTIRDLAGIVSELIDDTEIVHTPGRNGDFGGAVISNERAGEELGWRASTPLREGVSRYLAWLEPGRAQAAE
ncbi:MAG: NAD-dependent epimerase/dehydratase family protein, partial [Solirubrobacterales bacterium]